MITLMVQLLVLERNLEKSIEKLIKNNKISAMILEPLLLHNYNLRPIKNKYNNFHLLKKKKARK